MLDNVPALVDVLTALVKQEGDCTPDVQTKARPAPHHRDAPRRLDACLTEVSGALSTVLPRGGHAPIGRRRFDR
ncbi:MAG: hypothetical protein U0531_06440 [Dehalococcoidia bacterium]